MPPGRRATKHKSAGRREEPARAAIRAHRHKTASPQDSGQWRDSDPGPSASASAAIAASSNRAGPPERRTRGRPPPARRRRPRPTTARLGEYQPHPARPPAAGRELVDGHEPAMDELLPRLLVPLRPRPARRRARPCPVLPVRELAGDSATSRSPPDRSPPASTAAIAFRLIGGLRGARRRRGSPTLASPSEAAVSCAPVRPRTQSFRCCLDPLSCWRSWPGVEALKERLR